MNAISPIKELYCIEAEQNVLGSILIDGSTINRVIGFLKPEHFEPLHRKIYETFLNLHEQGRPITPLAVLNVLLEEKIDIDLKKYFHNLLKEHALTGPLAYDSARTVVDYSLRRKFQAELIASAAKLNLVSEPIERSALSLIQGCDEIISEASGYSDSLKFIGQISETVTSSIGSKQKRILSGPDSLDHLLGGYGSGQFIVIGARPAMGKTTIALQQALSVAKGGVGVLLLSLEMSDEQLIRRALAALASENSNTDKISYSWIERNNLNFSQTQRIKSAGEFTKQLPIAVDDCAVASVSQIETKVRRAKISFRRNYGTELGLLIVDYLGLISATNRYSGNKVAETGEISRALKALAKRENIPVVALCQLSREAEKRGEKRPTLADLRNSGDIEQDADVVIGLYREAYYATEAQRAAYASQDGIEFIVLKNRFGPTGTAHAIVNLASNEVW